MQYHEMVAQPKMLIVIAAYFVVVFAFAFLARKQKNRDSIKEFALAGKGLGSFVLMATFMASWMGGGAVAGSINSIAYTTGLFPSICYASGSIFAIVILFAIGPIVRKRGKLTTAALIEDSYGTNARVLSAVIIALASFSIVSYQLRAMGIILNATTGFDVNIMTLVACIVIIIATASGGLDSVVKIDAFSVCLMLVGLFAAFAYILPHVGGISWIVETTKEVNPQGLTFTGGWTAKDYLANYAPGFLLALGDNNLYQRMAAAKGDRNVQIGMIGWALGTIIVLPAIAFLSYIGRLYFGDNIIASQSFIALSTICPWVIGGLMMASCSGFILTTGNSYLLSGATNLATDVYTHFKKGAPDKQVLKVTKICIVVFGIASLVILQFFPSILAIQYWASTIVGAGITPALLASVVCPSKVTKAGGLASMAGGTILTIVWEMLGQPYGLATVLVAFPVSVALLVIVSACTHKKAAAQ
ncbi:MAG: sodium:solute symporter family protein [Clostridiales bacterium]|nr:sodium:solute symporter family protein [Clostridiales bacterium]